MAGTFRSAGAHEAPRFSGRKRRRSVSQARKLMALALFLLAQAIFYHSDFFRLRTIEVVGLERLSGEEVFRACGLPVGENVLSINTSACAELLRKNIFIKDVEIKKLFPGGVRIGVKERAPALVAAERGKEWFLADEEGLIFDRNPRNAYPDLPRVLLDEPLEKGRKIRSIEVGKFLAFASSLSSEEKARILGFEADSRARISFLYRLRENSVEVRIGGLENAEEKVSLLSKMMDVIGSKAETLESVDLSRKQPMVKFRRIEEPREGKRLPEKN